MGRKVAETVRDINHTFGPGTTNKHTDGRWFKKFHCGNKDLEDEEGRE